LKRETRRKGRKKVGTWKAYREGERKGRENRSANVEESWDFENFLNQSCLWNNKIESVLRKFEREGGGEFRFEKFKEERERERERERESGLFQVPRPV